jgi:mitogen-activated protein kinase kinase kinase 9
MLLLEESLGLIQFLRTWKPIHTKSKEKGKFKHKWRSNTKKKQDAYLASFDNPQIVEEKKEVLIKSNDLLVIKSDDLQFKKLLGSGGFGEVWLARWLSRQEDVAAKKVHSSKMNDRELKIFVDEANAMNMIRSAYTVPLLGICIEEGSYCLILEFAKKGSLYEFLQSDKEILWPLRYRLALEVAKGINYLHQLTPPLFHRDIKSLNVLLTEELHAKLSDFGMTSARTASNVQSSVGRVGTVQWTAPELFKITGKYTEKCDVYSYGMLLWEIASRQVPYSEFPEVTVRENIMEGERLAIPDGTPEPFGLLIQACWAQEAEKRPALSEIIPKLEAMLADPTKK